MLSDSHLHLHAVREGEYPYNEDIGPIFSCTAKPCDWNTLRNIRREGIKRFYGVHPWYADEWSEETKSALLALLDDDPSAGVGEIGLDGVRGSIPEQISAFNAQLDIASSMDRAVNIHMTDAEKEVLECIRKHAGKIPAVIHSFRSESYVKPLSALNCYFSINPRILSKKPESVKRIIDAVPRDRLLLESDAPHTVSGFGGMARFISDLADATGIPAEDLESAAYDNLRSIM